MQNKNPRSIDNASDGFVLSDMLILLAVVALLVVVQIPSMADGTRASSAETCRNNLRQLIQAWQMYTADTDGKLTPNNGRSAGAIGTWVGGWLDFTSSYDNLSIDNLVGFDGPNSNRNYGHLGPYLKTPAVFRCPSDLSTVRAFGRFHSRVRSVSMNGWMGGSVYCGQTQFRVYRKLDQIGTPAKRFVITEERPDSINDGLMLVDMIGRFVDFPAFYHNGGNWISFADGHIEHRRWTDVRTMPAFKAGYNIPLNVLSPNNPDLDWIRERTTELK